MAEMGEEQLPLATEDVDQQNGDYVDTTGEPMEGQESGGGDGPDNDEDEDDRYPPIILY